MSKSMTDYPKLASDIKIVLDFVERWNKGDKERDVANAAQRLNERALREEKPTPSKALEELELGEGLVALRLIMDKINELVRYVKELEKKL